MIVLGAAYQAGLIPVGAAAIEQAIELNVAAQMNTQAFQPAGVVADPGWLREQVPAQQRAGHTAGAGQSSAPAG
ncbi:MAG: hypothetical protein U0Z44_16805 [Kouleothrix sp.]